MLNIHLSQNHKILSRLRFKPLAERTIVTIQTAPIIQRKNTCTRFGHKPCCLHNTRQAISCNNPLIMKIPQPSALFHEIQDHVFENVRSGFCFQTHCLREEPTTATAHHTSVVQQILLALDSTPGGNLEHRRGCAHHYPQPTTLIHLRPVIVGYIGGTSVNWWCCIGAASGRSDGMAA